MSEWFHLERLLADRARDLSDHLAMKAAFRSADLLRERPVLSTGVGCWSWRRAVRVGAVVALALAGTIAVPVGIVGAAWAMGVVVRLFLG